MVLEKTLEPQQSWGLRNASFVGMVVRCKGPMKAWALPWGVPAGARSGRPACPPAGGCGAPGAWRQLCLVTRREDCRARGPGLRAASERALAPRRSRHRTRSAVRPPTRGEDDPPVATARGPFSVLGGEGEALRCERGAPPPSTSSPTPAPETSTLSSL